MSKYELTIDTGYVRDWAIGEAIRELFQNSIDGEKDNPENESYFHYSTSDNVLTIGNKLSVLSAESLLLGVSSKTDSDETVGQFGEGYKIATMVLLRTGHNVTFYNYGAREVWHTRLKKSRRYGGRLVPTFDIDKKFIWQTVPNRCLEIVIENVTPEEFEIIKSYILKLHDDIGDTLSTQYGDILLNEKYSGKVFVSGLYVTTNANLRYGYNFLPQYLKLDRDRQSVSDFNLTWMSSKMWIEHLDNQTFMDDLFSDESSIDIQYIKDMASYIKGANLSEKFKEQFIERYGDGVVPVSTQYDYDFVSTNGGKPVFTSKLISTIFANKLTEFSNNIKARISAYEYINDWFNRLKNDCDIPYSYIDEFENFLELYEDELS